MREAEESDHRDAAPDPRGANALDATGGHAKLKTQDATPHSLAIPLPHGGLAYAGSFVKGRLDNLAFMASVTVFLEKMPLCNRILRRKHDF
jgi:hypothetical protein